MTIAQLWQAFLHRIGLGQPARVMRGRLCNPTALR